ncbi:MAG: hypothetical protein IJI97_10495 [Clostridia bacterium]|nr:hypothetical protein [Clostridia bacterium]
MDDYISRQAAMDAIHGHYEVRNPDQNAEMDKISMLIFRVPSADVRPVVRGQWIEHEDPNGDPYYECSACHGEMVCIEGTPQDNEFYFCNYCGADLRRKQDADRQPGAAGAV